MGVRDEKSRATYNPDLKPAVPVLASRGSHGLRKFDWVTVWFFWWNSKVTVSPMDAVIFGGLYARSPLAPTVILWSMGTAAGVGANESLE